MQNCEPQCNAMVKDDHLTGQQGKEEVNVLGRKAQTHYQLHLDAKAIVNICKQFPQLKFLSTKV